MISLRSYIFGENSKNDAAAYRRIIGLFLQGISLHAVEGEKSDYDRFRANIEEFAKQITPDTSLGAILVAVGGALQAMEEYNRRTSKVVERQNGELQHMVSMLTQTLITVGSTGDASVAKLQDIEKSIERARLLEDIQLLKLRLGECLEAVRQESLRQKSEGQSALESLRKELENSRQRLGGGAPTVDRDAATGLPSKNEALKAIEAAVASPHNKFLAIASVRRVQAVNARFGHAVGDRMLAAFAEHFQGNLAANDQLFRWHGPAFLAVLERSGSLEAVRTETCRFADAKLEKTVEVGSRTVMLPISATWSIFNVTPPIEELFRKLEAFMAAQMPRELA